MGGLLKGCWLGRRRAAAARSAQHGKRVRRLLPACGRAASPRAPRPDRTRRCRGLARLGGEWAGHLFRPRGGRKHADCREPFGNDGASARLSQGGRGAPKLEMSRNSGPSPESGRRADPPTRSPLSSPVAMLRPSTHILGRRPAALRCFQIFGASARSDFGAAWNACLCRCGRRDASPTRRRCRPEVADGGGRAGPRSRPGRPPRKRKSTSRKRKFLSKRK